MAKTNPDNKEGMIILYLMHVSWGERSLSNNVSMCSQVCREGKQLHSGLSVGFNELMGVAN